MKTLKLFFVALVAFGIALPYSSMAEKIKGKSKNNGFEYMVSKRIPVIFNENLDLTGYTITSLAFNLKIYISYPYVINNEMSMQLFDDKSSHAKFKNRNINYFVRNMLLSIKTPELESYMQYIEYSKKTSSMFLLIIDAEGKVDNVVVINDDIPQPVSSQIKEYLKNSSWTPAALSKKENVKSVYFIVADFGELPNLRKKQEHPLEILTKPVEK